MDPSDSKGGAENVRESAKSLFKALAYHESSVSQPVPGWGGPRAVLSLLKLAWRLIPWLLDDRSTQLLHIQMAWSFLFESPPDLGIFCFRSSPEASYPPVPGN